MTKECYELLWYPNTYDFARGLALSGHLSSSSAAVVEQSGRRVLPFLDPLASPVGAAFLFLSPPAGGGEPSSSSSPFSREEGICWIFGQGGWTINLLHCRYPVLLNGVEA